MSTHTTERTTTLAAARTIVDRAKAADRELTPAEQAEVEQHIAHVKNLDRKVASGQLVDRVMALGGVGRGPDPEASGDLFSEDAKAGIVHATKTRTAYRTEVDAKAALTTGTMLPTVGVGLQPGLYPTGVFPLSSLFRQEAAPGPSIRFYRMGAGSAAVVAEGGLKPDASVSITPVDLVLEKLACLSQFSTEMAEDAPFLVSHLQAELGQAVATAENSRVLSAFNSTSGVLTGTGATAAVVDVVAQAIAAQEAFSGKTPSAVVAHPNVVAAIRTAKAAAGSWGLRDRPHCCRTEQPPRRPAHLHPSHRCGCGVGDRGQRGHDLPAWSADGAGRPQRRRPGPQHRHHGRGGAGRDGRHAP